MSALPNAIAYLDTSEEDVITTCALTLNKSSCVRGKWSCLNSQLTSSWAHTHMILIHWLTKLGRALYLLLFAAVALAIYGFGRLWLGISVRDLGVRRARISRWRGRVLRRSMTMLGATFIKIGQVMSSRPDLLAPEVVAELKLLLDRLPSFPFRKARRIVETGLGRTIEDVYVEFDVLPVAAASVAQVHRARLRDGREVAVKVLRPNIRDQVERDTALLLFAARLLAIHPTIRINDPVGHIRHFAAAILRQTDLTIEAQNYAQFRENFRAVPRVVFPFVHSELCAESVLTMEFVHGTRFEDRDRSRDRELAAALRHLIFKMSFEDGFLHCDLHPGNFLVTDSHELAVFDVGLAARLEGQVFDQFFDFSRSLVLGTADDFVSHMKKFGTYDDEPNWEGFRSAMAQVLPKYRRQNIGELEYIQLFDDMFRVAREFRSRPVPELVMVMVAFLTAQGIGKVLDPDSNIFHEVAGFLGPLLARRAAERTAQAS